MMKNYNIIFLSCHFLFSSCYSDDEQIIESIDTTHRSSELTSMIKSMTLHNASFDDHVDSTSCFSLVFPYDLSVNSEQIRVNSIQNLQMIDEADNIEILFPVNIVFFNYNEHEVRNTSELTLLTNSCENDFGLEPNSCLNFEYPISIKQYNQSNTNFETLVLDSNIEVFRYLDTLHEDDVYEIEYPVALIGPDSETNKINSNSEFMSIYESSINSCP
ncbi:hypothetical protein [Psychroflexus tropicus]|uniref:hypothetical protein n=1 Tax=Psychroflexus tropicus TaxID=197345 RepID=UPI00037BCF5A|nr:hypothetical protein [Psychroflexus tropicus]